MHPLNLRDLTPNMTPSNLRIFRIIAIVAVLAAIAYIVLLRPFHERGIVGYVDDFFVFMAAFTFAHGSFQRPERRAIRRQLYKIAALFCVLALCWVGMLALTPPPAN